MLPSGRLTWGPSLIFCLLLHGVFTLMYLCVAPVSAMTYCSRLADGLLPHVVLVLLKNSKCLKLSSLLGKFKLLVEEINFQRPCGRPKVMPPNLVVSVAWALCQSLVITIYYCMDACPMAPTVRGAPPVGVVEMYFSFPLGDYSAVVLVGGSVAAELA